MLANLKKLGFALIQLTETQKKALKDGHTLHEDSPLSWGNIAANLKEDATQMTTDDNEIIPELEKWRAAMLKVVNEHINKVSLEIKNIHHVGLRSQPVDDPNRILNAQRLHQDTDVLALGHNDKRSICHCCILTLKSPSALLVIPESHQNADWDVEDTRYLTIPPYSILLFHGNLVHAGPSFFEYPPDGDEYYYRFFASFTFDDDGDPHFKNQVFFDEELEGKGRWFTLQQQPRGEEESEAGAEAEEVVHSSPPSPTCQHCNKSKASCTCYVAGSSTSQGQPQGGEESAAEAGAAPTRTSSRKHLRRTTTVENEGTARASKRPRRTITRLV